MKEKKYKSLNITVSPEIIKKLNEGNYNKNKLIVSLFRKYLQNLKNK